MNNLEREYERLARDWQFRAEALDYEVLHRHIHSLEASPMLQHAAVTIYDNYRHCHAYASPYHQRLFGPSEVEVHPDDLEAVLKNAIATLRHIFQRNPNMRALKLVREYRAMVRGDYRRVNEQMQVLEPDADGNPWLMLCVMEISPNQSPIGGVTSRILNTETGENFSPLDRYYDQSSVLSARESQILQLIATGLLSKEISSQLSISVHTVNTHRQRILEKLGVDTSIEAVSYGRSLGMIV